MKTEQSLAFISNQRLFLIFLIGFSSVLRLVYLNQGIWFDEVVTLVKFVRPSLSQIVGTYQSENQHMLYSLLSHFSIGVFGEHIWSLRLPAVIFGVATIPALYYLGMLISSRLEAILASLLLMVSYHHIWFSQNARGYTMLLFWTILSTCFIIRALRENEARLWMWYAISTSLGAFSHLTMGFVAFSHLIVFMFRLIRDWWNKNIERDFVIRPLLIGFGLTGIFTLLLYAPMLSDIISHFRGGKLTVESQWTNPLWSALETFRGLKAGFGGVIMVVGAIAVFSAGLLNYLRKNLLIPMLFLLPGILGFITVLVLGHNIWPRFFFFLSGFMVLFMVSGTMEVSKLISNFLERLNFGKIEFTKIGTVLLIILALMSLYSLRNVYLPKQDFEGALKFVEQSRQMGDTVVTVGMSTFPYQNYYQTNWQSIETTAELNYLIQNKEKVWLVYTFPVYVKSRHPNVWTAIQKRFQTVEIFPGTIGGGQIYVSTVKRQG